MTPDEFLALVEKYPPPYRFDARDCVWSDQHGDDVADEYGGCAIPPDLLDSLPALAAAAIRLLRILDDPGAFDEHQERDAIEALRAALPTELRP